MAKLPIVGSDWLYSCTGMYIILSLKHSTADRLQFWQANECGYTPYLVNAGKYTYGFVQENCLRLNDGINTVAIPLTATALDLWEFDLVSVRLADIDLRKFANIVE